MWLTELLAHEGIISSPAPRGTLETHPALPPPPSTGAVRALPEPEVFGIHGMIPEGRRDENFRHEGIAEKLPLAMRILREILLGLERIADARGAKQGAGREEGGRGRAPATLNGNTTRRGGEKIGFLLLGYALTSGAL